MSWDVLAFLIALAVTALVAGPTAVWFLCMRPYIRDSGRYPATGAIWGYSQIVDFFSILAICREERHDLPWFMYVWGSITLFWLVVPILLLVMGVLRGCVVIQ